MNNQETFKTIIDTQKVRFFRFQKVIFLGEIKALLDKLDIKSDLITDVYNKQKYHSLIIGDLKTAKKIYVTHYDTSSFSMGLFDFEAFNSQKRQRISFLLDIIKLIVICIVSGTILFDLIQSVLNSENTVINVALSLGIFFLSVLLIRLPGFIPNKKNENSNTLKFLIDLILEKKQDVSVIWVDDGMTSQMGYQILGRNLRLSKRVFDIVIYEKVVESHQPFHYIPAKIEETNLKFFEGLNVKAITS